MIQSIDERQLSLDFGDTKPFVAPSFRRAPDAKRNLPGISPRDGFEFAAELVQGGVSESEIAPQLVEFIQKKQQRIRKLLMRLTNTKLAIDFEQASHAAELDTALKEISELSTAWWLFEMNLTPIIQSSDKNTWPSIMKLIKDFRKEMGMFRTYMEKEYGIIRQ